MASRRLRHALLALATLSSAPELTSSVARACSAPATTVRLVLPADGARSVPTNARVRLVLDAAPFGSHDGEDVLRLVHLESGREVPVEVTVAELGFFDPDGLRPARLEYVATPDAVLEPLSEYDVWLGDALDCGPGGCGAGSAPVARFVTGDETDLVPPSPPTNGGAAVFAWDACDGEACCGPYLVAPLTASWDRAPDDGPVAYRVLGRGSDLTTERRVHGYQVCSGWHSGWSSFTSFATYGSVLEVQAVDLAGNESEWVHIELGDGCPGSEVGAGGEPTPSPGGDTGCQVGQGPSGRRGWAALGSALLMLGVGRRRAWRPGRA